jgi:hypothetical protein
MLQEYLSHIWLIPTRIIILLLNKKLKITKKLLKTNKTIDPHINQHNILNNTRNLLFRHNIIIKEIKHFYQQCIKSPSHIPIHNMHKSSLTMCINQSFHITLINILSAYWHSMTISFFIIILISAFTQKSHQFYLLVTFFYSIDGC